MITLLSDAKSLNYKTPIAQIKTTTPIFLQDSKNLVDNLKKLSSKDLEKLMVISPKLAEINWQRFHKFSLPFNKENSNPALFLFDGDVYQAMEIAKYSLEDLEFTQNNLKILSGLYGILKPLDLIQDYRLEMGTNIKIILGKNLAQFWQQKVASHLNNELKNQTEKTIINLASAEYFAVVDKSNIDGKIINIIFKEKIIQNYNITYKNIGLFSKKARGLMINFIIKNKIINSEDLKNFAVDSYNFKSELSDQNNWFFYRK
jgi:hypothetical protein